MNYEFPEIAHIDDLLPAIAGRDEFIVAVKEGYTVINYAVAFEDTFPPIKVAGGSAKMRAERSLHNRLRRECRGIIFDTETGVILRRPYHKFFNVNEREETQDHHVNLGNDHAILEKLDGSMIAPFIVNGEMIWGTKMGATDVAKPVEEFVKNNPDYEFFARETIDNGWTPIFEWCSNKQRIVMDHPEDQLILTAIRGLHTGSYWRYEDLEEVAKFFDIPYVKVLTNGNDNMSDFVKYVHGLEDLEGFVVRFDNGHMVKLKCAWYVQIHKAKDKILQDRNIVEMIINENLDDIKAHLPPEDRDRITEFENAFNQAVSSAAGDILALINRLRAAKLDKKGYALSSYHAETPGLVRPIVFRYLEGEAIDLSVIRSAVVSVICSHLGRNAKYDEVRDLWFPNVAFNQRYDTE